MPSETNWWGRRAPYTREALWAAVSSLAVLGSLVALLIVFWPALLTAPELMVPGAALGCVVGVGLAVGGLKFGYWMEDRREARRARG